MKPHLTGLKTTLTTAAGLVVALVLSLVPETGAAATCARNLTADVVALDQVYFYNRLGAHNPAGMMFALRRDVRSTGATPDLVAGEVALRSDKRPRPLVLRMNVGDCLTVNFQNLLSPTPIDGEQPATRTASFHAMGMQLVNSIADDGSYVGTNPSSLVSPGGHATYTFYAEAEGTYLAYSTAATTGGEGNGGGIGMGLFGGINVEPAGAEWYRSQLTRDDLDLATKRHPDGTMQLTPDGHPILDYDATYPDGTPILAMLSGNEIVNGDINAIITGPGRGDFPPGTYIDNPVAAPNFDKPQAVGPGVNVPPTRTRSEPFREFTVIWHDEVFAIQAFPGFFEDPVLEHTLGCCRDAFAINYGTAGIGAEVIANRLGVGPMAECNECKYEEFFLSSWTVGDPSMIVDVPANAGLELVGPGDAVPPGALGPKATKVHYPDDPSSVQHSYLGDHVKIRNLHAGPKEHHIFHLHAHQWLFNPNSDTSTYLDSQSIGPGSGYTYEINYNGSGNRNMTAGDSIHHCHFYPHFAQGMWNLWRVHDVFERGTELDADGRPIAGSRALPDIEIAAGTPIPAVVPIPTLAMPPMPGPVEIVAGDVVLAEDLTVNPGYPFYIPGKAGHRAPHPPLDTVDDGGLPRHVVTGGTATSVVNRLSFRKTNDSLDVEFLPESGLPIELLAMDFHAQRTHASFTPAGDPVDFVTNGLPAVAGAPFADPCVDDQGNAVGSERLYKAAHVQLDIVYNKVGSHFPQSRIHLLWDDVAPTLAGLRPPEPLFFRANTGDCMVYHLTSLFPSEYKLDDFQVLTPTDITGQHIHLVKFDVTSSDGSANGWNYEDGAFVPEEVQERIHAIRVGNGCVDGDPINDPVTGELRCPVAEPHPFFGGDIGLGAQTVVQRWYVDDVINNQGEDRTLRTVYTHDHFAPSTHQQTGLYAALVSEPADSVWRHPETGDVFGTRFDGGPTSWRADILTAGTDAYREFLLEFTDFGLAYMPGGPSEPSTALIMPEGVERGFTDPERAINPPGREEIGMPLMLKRPEDCPGGADLPCAEGVSADDPGTFWVNYRNESLALRVLDSGDPNNPHCMSVDNLTTNCQQAAGEAGDLAYALRSDVPRALAALNTQPVSPAPLTGGVLPGDPFTPLMRAYQGDNVQIRVLVGAQEEGHIFNVHGMKWLQDPSDKDSGWRNAQMMGISEQFTFSAPVVPITDDMGPWADYLYTVDSSADAFWNGSWGIFRAYDRRQGDLLPLPDNPFPASGAMSSRVSNLINFNGVCPIDAPIRRFTVYAVTAADALPGGTLTYNSRVGAYPDNPGPLHDPTALLYLRSEDVRSKFTRTGRKYVLRDGKPIEPLILRANAGDCIEVTVINTLPDEVADLDGFNLMPMTYEFFNINQVKPSSHVGLHPQMVAFDVTRHNGVNVGMNSVREQTAEPGGRVRYRWYAGDISFDDTGKLVGTPVEFGATNLMPADPVKQASKGLVGALIIEPEGATWEEDEGMRAAATVTKANGETFREFVLMFQDDLNLRDSLGAPICPVRAEGGHEEPEPGGPICAGVEDAEDSGNKALNYRTEPMWFRKGFFAGSSFEDTRNVDFTDSLSNGLVGGDPETPVFTAYRGENVRFRVLQAGGHPRNHVFQVHGHAWQRMPHGCPSGACGPDEVASQVITNNPLSEVYGAQVGHGPANHWDFVLLNGAGGAFGVPGDYLYRNQASFAFDGGMWGLLRVLDGVRPAPEPEPDPLPWWMRW